MRGEADGSADEQLGEHRTEGGPVGSSVVQGRRGVWRTCAFVERRIADADATFKTDFGDGRFLLLALGVVDGVGLLIARLEDADLFPSIR